MRQDGHRRPASKVLTSEASTEGKLVSPGPINRPVIYVRSFCYLVNWHGTPAQERGTLPAMQMEQQRQKKSGIKVR